MKPLFTISVLFQPYPWKDGIAMWSKISIFVALPVIGICAYNAFRLERAHKEHIEHHGRPPFIPYSHLRLRNKVCYYNVLSKNLL